MGKGRRYFRDQKAQVILVDHNPECQAREFVSSEDFLVKDAKDAWDLAHRLLRNE